MENTNYEHYKEFLNTILNKTRFDIIVALKKGPKCVGELASELSYEQSRISHNLKRLETQGFVTVKRKGKKIYYALEKNRDKLLDNLDEFINKESVRR